MNRQTHTTWLPAALAAALSLTLYAGPWIMPLLGALASLVAPLPLVILYRRYGTRAGRLGVALAMGGAMVFFQALLGGGGLYFLYHAALALVMGEALELGLRGDWALGSAAAASILVLVVILGLGGLFSGQGIWEAWKLQWRNELDMVIAMYQQAGLKGPEVEQVRRTLEAMGRLLMRLGPGIMIGGSLLVAWVNLLLARTLTPRLAPRVAAGLEPLDTWQAPERLVWVFIAGAALTAFTGGWTRWLGANLILVLGVLYYFQGMAVLAHWMTRKKVPRFVRVGIYAFIALEFFLALLVAAAGLFDMWFNFRKLEKSTPA